MARNSELFLTMSLVVLSHYNGNYLEKSDHVVRYYLLFSMGVGLGAVIKGLSIFTLHTTLHKPKHMILKVINFDLIRSQKLLV